jgi:hypothetical protein
VFLLALACGIEPALLIKGCVGDGAASPAICLHPAISPLRQF